MQKIDRKWVEYRQKIDRKKIKYNNEQKLDRK